MFRFLVRLGGGTGAQLLSRPVRSLKQCRLNGALASLALALTANNTWAQTPIVAPRELPFAISDEKRLSDSDLSEKKEGIFVTGLPDLSLDPLSGFGLGAQGYLTSNGTRKDPFFAYTPYRWQLGLEAFVTTKLTRAFVVSLDAPYFLNTKWRVRAEAAYEVNPNQLYFGTTTNTVSNLGQLLPSNSQFAGSHVSSYNDYSSKLATIRPGTTGEDTFVSDNHYDYYTKDEKILNISLERSFWEGRFRVVGGFELAFLNIGHQDGHSVEAKDPLTGHTRKVKNGTTRITLDEQAGSIFGGNGGRVTILQTGLVYDTRDLEPDPSSGIFAELTNELSTAVLGSTFTFDKVFLQAKFFQSLLPKTFSKLVLAGRIGLGDTIGDAPFFEFADQWSTEGSIEGLGGFHTLRGYKQSRFMARTMGFANVELRYRFAHTQLFGQTFGFMVVPFFDVGGVWDGLDHLNASNLRYSEGAGLRASWNQSTIIAADFAFSQEDQQFFIELSHAF